MSGVTGAFHQRDRVRASDADPRGRATPAALVRLLQDAAGDDARRRGFGIADQRARGTTWYLKRLHLRLARAPRVGETVEVVTWPAELDRLMAIRDYRLLVAGDAGATEVGVASSAWLLVDVASGKAVRRPPAELGALHGSDLGRALATDFPRLPPLADAARREVPFTLRRADLDLNGHVNHGVLVEGLVEAVDDALWTAAELAELEVDFRRDARPDDRIVVRAVRGEKPADGGDVTVLLGLFGDEDGDGDGVELVRARSRWRRAR